MKTLSKKRHQFWKWFWMPTVRSLSKKVGAKVEGQIDEPNGCVVLGNHETSCDQFFVAMMCKQVPHYMATKDLIEHFFIGKFLMHQFHMIVKEKNNTHDLAPIKECIQFAKENATVAIFPEGNRTFDGNLCSIEPSTAKLLKKMNKPVYFLNIDGYYVEPRWATKARPGTTYAFIRDVLQPEDIQKMSDEELLEYIKDKLTVKRHNEPIKCDYMAEYFERIGFICPVCGHMHQITSAGNIIKCNHCGLEVTVDEYQNLHSTNKDFKFNTVSDWYKYQIEVLKNKEYKDGEVIFSDEALLAEPRDYRNLKKHGDGKLEMYNNKIVFTNKKNQVFEYQLDDIENCTILGRKKILFYHKDGKFQFIGDKYINFSKYMFVFYILKYKAGKNPNYYLGI